MALTVGTRLGPYEILAPIGAGGMGQVYRARPHNPKAGSDSIPIEHGPAQFNAFYPRCSGRTLVRCTRTYRRSIADRILEEQVRMVEELLDQWYGPNDSFFKVRADDGNLYILRREGSTPEGTWTLEPFRELKTQGPTISDLKLFKSSSDAI